MLRRKVTPPSQSLPDADSASVPTPWMVTVTEDGGQPPVSRYSTEKVKVVVVVPLPGDAEPAASLGVCEAPLQLEAWAGTPAPPNEAIDRTTRPPRMRIAREPARVSHRRLPRGGLLATPVACTHRS